MITTTKVYAADVTLDEVVTSFNNCKTVKDYMIKGSLWEANSMGTSLIVTATSNGTTYNIEYTLENTVLSAMFSGEEEFVTTGALASVILADSIGQLHGYEDGELFPTLNSDQITSYTLDNEGIEMRKLSETSYQVKMDMNKKVPLADFSNVYIEVSDLQDIKSYITGDGFAEKSKGYIWLGKSGENGENVVLIAEKNDLTENAYKSLLSVIQVMFESNNEVYSYFQENYTSIADGDKEFKGFKIELNPTKTAEEEQLIPTSSGAKFARVTISRSNALEFNSQGGDNNQNNPNEPATNPTDTSADSGSTGSEKAENTAAENKSEDKVVNTVKNTVDNTTAKGTKIPQTGGESLIHVIIKYMIILISLILVGMVITDTRKGKN